MANKDVYLRVLSETQGPCCEDCAAAAAGWPHRQLAFQLAEALYRRGDIERGKGVRCRRCERVKKCSWLREHRPEDLPAGPTEGVSSLVPSYDGANPSRAAEFEILARQAMSSHFGVTLTAGVVGSVPKVWDMVSGDGSVVGDAKFFSLVHGTEGPSAKLSVISEHAWLLEKTEAKCQFLVFGSDPRVCRLWAQRYGRLAPNLAIFFLDANGDLESVLGAGRDTRA